MAEVPSPLLSSSIGRLGDVLKSQGLPLNHGLPTSPKKRRRTCGAGFRADDRRHASALLELATHEILRAVAKDVQVGPAFNGAHPDFSAIYGDTSLIVECTVAQESDGEFGALQRERVALGRCQLGSGGLLRLEA